ncbi:MULTISPECIES: membrane protein [unclassified Stenotrophomonas]|jgi:VanZ family protein|uniref:membrane protein n=1 Tax=unclassified Stenotrophomonas TaxID=196198 RepID=UPI0005AEF98D|nr:MULTISPECIES: membrane protein [unclassified Stenotrophomonas]KIP85239.1 membrane protein [Stenotrophomonas maltophilia]MBD8642073.1 VanZ family protein [Stenotrophomonas sp. CFBP 13724]MDY1032625.1 VanZ family protein [Stenotrophomonas sp. CFBP8980]
MWLKPLRHRRFWLCVWLAAVATVIVVCLIPPPPLALPQGSDKVEHFLAYFLLGGSAVQVFQRGRALLWVAVGLVLMGVGIEIAQGALTETRMADPGDALANTVGVVAGLATALTPWRDLLLRLRG